MNCLLFFAALLSVFFRFARGERGREKETEGKRERGRVAQAPGKVQPRTHFIFASDRCLKHTETRWLLRFVHNLLKVRIGE